MIGDETNKVVVAATRLLRDVSSVLARREEFLDASGDAYNAFEALWLSQEKFHSRMIGTLLSSESRHGLGTLFLHRFFETLGIGRFPIPDAKRGVSVTIEKYIGEIPNDTYESGGIIDILVESTEWMLAIENKIDESDRNNQKKQLYRYWNWLKSKRGESFILVYLTPSGKMAPNESISGDMKHLESGKDKDYICVSYEQVANWIDACIRDSVRFPRIRETLVQYRDFLDQYVLPNRKEDKYMNEIETLIQNGSFAAADAIANALPKAKEDAMGALLEKVFAAETIQGRNVQKGSSEDWKRFADPNSATDSNPCHLFWFERPLTNEIVALALAWLQNRPVIGITCSDGGALGDELIRRFATQKFNDGATEYWPYLIWLDCVHLDTSFFDSKEDQERFCGELKEKFSILSVRFSEVVADYASEETT